jgi:hypothetical protein
MFRKPRFQMIDDNYSHRTAKTYVRTVREFAEYFHRPPDKLGPEHIRQYQAYLFQSQKLSTASVSQYVSALRFFINLPLAFAWDATADHSVKITNREDEDVALVRWLVWCRITRQDVRNEKILLVNLGSEPILFWLSRRANS